MICMPARTKPFTINWGLSLIYLNMLSSHSAPASSITVILRSTVSIFDPLFPQAADQLAFRTMTGISVVQKLLQVYSLLYPSAEGGQ